MIIVGGGFAGLRAARKLARRPLEVTLVDRRNFHLFQPLEVRSSAGAWVGSSNNLVPGLGVDRSGRGSPKRRVLIRSFGSRNNAANVLLSALGCAIA